MSQCLAIVTLILEDFLRVITPAEQAETVDGASGWQLAGMVVTVVGIVVSLLGLRQVLDRLGRFHAGVCRTATHHRAPSNR